MQRLIDLSTDMLCIKENIYMECDSLNGVKTYPDIFRFFDDGKKQMLVIYREEYINEIVGILENMQMQKPIKTYVFSPSDDPATELFDSVEDKVELTALPAAIYNTYVRILPKRKTEYLDKEKEVEESEKREDLGGLFNKQEE